MTETPKTSPITHQARIRALTFSIVARPPAQCHEPAQDPADRRCGDEQAEDEAQQTSTGRSFAIVIGRLSG